MSFDSKELWSDLAREGTPPYFFKNPDHIVYDFDQGTGDPTMFPKADLARMAQLITDRDGSPAFDYFDHDYGYAGIFVGWEPLREEIARYLSNRETKTPT